MSWIGAKASPKSSVVKREQTAPPKKSSLELPTVVSSRGIPPCNAIIEHLTAGQCRLRSVILFERNAILEFDVKLAGRPILAVRGRVASRTSVPPRFTYEIVLEKMTPRETDELAKGVAESYRGNPRLREIPSLRDIPTTDGLVRTKVRQESEFSLQYRTPKEGFKNAKASNISTGGMRMVCNEAIVEGMLLELSFCLPSDVLAVYPEETMVLDLRNPLRRNAVPSKLRKPFEDMILYARVIHHDPLGAGMYEYGLEFRNLERREREELARYVDAVRHLRKLNGNTR